MSHSPAERSPYADQLPKLTDASSAPDEVLVAAGHLLRRAGAVDADASVIERALAAVSVTELASSLGAERVRACADRMRRAADEAFEVALPVAEEESRMWASAAMEALAERDALESARVALGRVAEVQAEAAELSATLSESLAGMDRDVRPLMRYFVALNAERRRERDLISEAHRQDAFWFSERADCDGLIGWLAGTAEPGPHAQSCSLCRSDLEGSALPGADRHVEASDWLRYESGATSEAQKAWIVRHAEQCERCGEIMRLADELDVEAL